MLFTHNNAQYSLSTLPDFYAYTVWFDSAKKGKILLPHWRMLWEYTLFIWMLPLTLYERICCHISIYRQLKGTEYLLLQD